MDAESPTPDMVMVYTSLDAWRTDMVRSALESAGIKVVQMPETLGAVTGEVPFMETSPQLFVLPSRAPAARDIIAGLESASEDIPDWHCPGCGEEVEGVFSECWKCGTLAPSAS